MFFKNISNKISSRAVVPIKKEDEKVVPSYDEIIIDCDPDGPACPPDPAPRGIQLKS